MAGCASFVTGQQGEIVWAHLANPAVATGWSHTVPAGQIWAIQQIKQRAILVGGAFNRDCMLTFSEPGGAPFNVVGNSSGVRKGAGTSLIYHSINNGNYNRVLAFANSFALPEMYLPASSVITCAWSNLVAPDALDEITFLVKVWRTL